MREETWYRWFVLSVIIHLAVLVAFSVPMKKAARRLIPAGSYYSVNIVGSPGGGDAVSEGPGRTAPEAKKPAQQEQERRPQPARQKPVPVRKEPEGVSLSKKKAPEKPPTPSKQELSRLDERLREMRKRTEPLDVTGKRGGGPGAGTGGLPVAGGGSGGRMLNPAEERYISEVWEKIRNAWAVPGLASFKRDLETIVTIRIRKDGRIVDISMEKRSGNRVYDESILRVLRAVDPLPPIPDSLNTDAIELGFRFLPEGLS